MTKLYTWCVIENSKYIKADSDGVHLAKIKKLIRRVSHLCSIINNIIVNLTPSELCPRIKQK